jgi:hypothetical protein
MGADKSAENTPIAPKFICPSLKVWGFDEKRLHWASVVRAKIRADIKAKKEAKNPIIVLTGMPSLPGTILLSTSKWFVPILSQDLYFFLSLNGY